MKLTITATDKPKDQHFNYSLELSGKQIQNTTLIICGTVLLGIALKAYLKK
ncbi:hypothetical protein ACVRWL_07540 [Streptococcus ratti]|uniref:Uncharacterized protein n=2 Tax=Streptococcus ratti TaxID=1341 RepID=A0A7X9LEE6_STRRT|nr:hypothetical protein [Streptococcus ratti]VEI59425.1 DNA polymerase III PolC [Streptococcus mutans]EJN94903.1 hypothetical protein SRA_00927 [Streptococcus ratti FA-1 = DSM 20564]EMP70244.1 hypothetical protein D822_04840 [Streptococcus ratti FA-1 = DSM 20564]NMD49459.1 hypothetical protein [Streptococcus ratti]QEY07003.1 hypothetical protein FY406_04735 [Streptococcus ratti]